MDRLVAYVCIAGRRRWIAVLMPSGLGDLIIFMAAYRHIRAYYAERPMLLICTSANRPYAQAYFKPEWIIELDRQNFRRYPWYRISIVSTMAKAGIDIILQPAQNREHMVEDALVRASGALERIGDAGSPILITGAERAAGDRWYTKLSSGASGFIHDAEFYAAFAARVTGSNPAQKMLRLPRPARHPNLPCHDYLVIAGEASSAKKTWPFEHFLTAAAAIAANSRLMIVLTGKTGQDQISQRATILDMRGNTDIEGMIAVLAHAKLVLCNDSGPAHLAAVLGVPVVAVGNGAMPSRYLPYPADEPGIFAPIVVLTDPPLPCFGCGWRCEYTVEPGAPVPCVAAVTVASVVDAALSILDKPTLEPAV